jgi:hypothetical protein
LRFLCVIKDFYLFAASSFRQANKNFF